MRLIGIPASAVQRAKAKADEMGLLNNSITSGRGNVAGFVGEEVARFVMGGTEKNTFDYDLILDELYRNTCICTFKVTIHFSYKHS